MIRMLISVSNKFYCHSCHACAYREMRIQDICQVKMEPAGRAQKKRRNSDDLQIKPQMFHRYLTWTLTNKKSGQMFHLAWHNRCSTKLDAV